MAGASASACFSTALERFDVVVEMLDEHPAAVVFHRSQQPRQQHRRIRRPVAVVAAVQLCAGPYTVMSTRVTPRAPKMMDLLPRLVHRSVAHQPEIGSEQVLVGGQRAFEIRRSRLFFAFERELDVRLSKAMPAARIASRRSGWRRSGALSSAAPTRIQAPLGIERRAGWRERDHTPPSSTRLSRSVGSNGGVAHSSGSSGWPS